MDLFFLCSHRAEKRNPTALIMQTNGEQNTLLTSHYEFRTTIMCGVNLSAPSLPPRPQSFKRKTPPVSVENILETDGANVWLLFGGGGDWDATKWQRLLDPITQTNLFLFSDGRAASWPSPRGPEDGTDDGCGRGESGTKQSQGSIISVKQASFEPCVWLKSQWMEVEGVCVMGGLLGSALLKWCQMDYLQKRLCCAHFQFIISKWGCRAGEDEWRTMCPHVQAVFKGPAVSPLTQKMESNINMYVFSGIK